jgi:NCS1 family nucleobase:cation symporter-1
MAHVAILDVNCATFASNAAGFQRYARRPFDVIPGSIIGFPIANFIVGNLVCASSQVIFGELIWNFVALLDMI